MMIMMMINYREVKNADDIPVLISSSLSVQ